MKTETSTNPATGSIHMALAAIMRDMTAVAKARENTAQGFKFRGIDDVYNELHPIFAAHGVVCLPLVDTISIAEAGRTKAGHPINRSVVTIGYRFSASDGSSVEAKMVGEGLDSADKATAKALSAAHKYLLLQTFLVPTSDIVDADYYPPTVNPRETLRNREIEAMQKIMEQHEDDAALATSDEEKKRLLGLAAEMRCKIADAEGPTAAEAAQATAETPAPEQKQEGDWRSVVMHIGTATGPFKGKTVGEVFDIDDAHKASTLMLSVQKNYIAGVEKIMAGERQGKNGPPTEQDAKLYAAIMKAQDSIQAKAEAQK